jgi:DNA excision repair protein ERCC-4
MRGLLAGKLFLWPRFEARVIEDLNHRQPEVVELAVPLTERMSRMYLALQQLTLAIVDEILKAQIAVDVPKPTLENVFRENWYSLISGQLWGQWILLGMKTKQLLADLLTMRKMGVALLHYDCVLFNRYLETIRMEKMVHHSDWLFHDAADVLFSNARARVLIAQPTSEETVFVLESQPKWSALKDVLAEIRAEEVESNVLIVVKDERVAGQVSGMLSRGETAWLLEQWNTSVDRGMYRARSAPMRQNSFHGSETKKKKQKPFHKGRSSSVSAPKRSIAEIFAEPKKNQDGVGRMPVLAPPPSSDAAARRDEFDRCFGVMKTGVVVKALDGQRSDVATCLEQLRPLYVIMYDTDLAVLRGLECYKNTVLGSAHPMRVYLLTYDVESEDTRELESENEAFEKLIAIKAGMLVEEERGQVMRDENPNIDTSAVVSTRVGGASSQNNLVRPSIVVDTREFMGSKIPAKLWSVGFDVVPVMLEIGDYVVSNDIVIERKTVPDLIGSFADGRLFKQCTHMLQHYSTVILLLEFNGSAFVLQSRAEILPQVTHNSLSSKLALLVLHFPKLRIFWSRDTNQSVAFVRALRKAGTADPDLERIARTSVTSVRQGAGGEDVVVDMTARQLLGKMPGVLSGTVDAVAQKAKTLRGLCTSWDVAEYAPIMGKDNAALLNSFLTRIYAKDDDPAI